LGETFAKHNPLDEVLRLIVRFKVPLQRAEAITDDIRREFTEMMECDVIFISLSTEVFGGGCLMLLKNLICEVLYFLFNYFFPTCIEQDS